MCNLDIGPIIFSSLHRFQNKWKEGEQMKVIILAGGAGSRLWPLSRERFPKQFIKLQGREFSLFQEAFNRSVQLAGLNNIYVITNKDYKFLVKGEIEDLGYNFSEENILVEPEAKNTLPAIFAGVNEVIKKERGSLSESFVVFPSDHLIEKSIEFIEIIKSAEHFTGDALVTFGIKPANPNTGYGYISLGEVKGNGYLVKEFKEKPDYQTALEYIKEGYFWNSGIFMFNSRIFLEEAAMYTPEVFNAFEGSKNLEEAFGKIEGKPSIDYGIMEKSKRVVVVPVDIGWNDLGSFDTFYEVFKCDGKNNIVGKEHVLVDCSNNLVFSEEGKLVVTIGIDDVIIVDNKDALLVCKKEQSQKVKEVVDELKRKKDLRAEYHVWDYRPWGSYQILEEEKNAFKVKRLKINSGKKISYQVHHHRSEHWIVVRGTAKVTLDGEDKIVNKGESIDIKAGQKHRIENVGELVLEIIEVQMGEYLEEDDIVRFDDEYGRK